MEQTFQITITSCRNFTYQGTLTGADGVPVPFRSELELLLELAGRLPMEHPRFPGDGPDTRGGTR